MFDALTIFGMAYLIYLIYQPQTDYDFSLYAGATFLFTVLVLLSFNAVDLYRFDRIINPVRQISTIAGRMLSRISQPHRDRVQSENFGPVLPCMGVFMATPDGTRVVCGAFSSGGKKSDDGPSRDVSHGISSFTAAMIRENACLSTS